MKTPPDGHASNPRPRKKACGSLPCCSPDMSTSEWEVERAKRSCAHNTRATIPTPPLTPQMSKNGPVLEALPDLQQPRLAVPDLIRSHFVDRPQSPPRPQDRKQDRSVAAPKNGTSAEPATAQTIERARPLETHGRGSPQEYEALAPTMQPSPQSICEPDLNSDDLSGRLGDSNSSCSPRSNTSSETPYAHNIMQSVSMEDWPVPGISKAAGDSPISGDPISKGSGAGQPSSKKRHHKAALGETPGSDLSDEHSPATRRRTQESDKGPEPLLACPFYKRDRQKYQNCLHYQLRRIKDVKQHITRQHSQPDFYCARCYDVFESAVHRDDHTRSTSCEIRDPPQFDGVSPQEKKRLNQQYSSRGKTVEGQWHDMWDIIFPGASWPETVYVGNYIDEVIQLLRAVWDNRGSWIISRVAGTNRPGGLDREDLDCTIRLLLDAVSENSGPASELPGTVMLPTSPCESPAAPAMGTSRSYTSVPSSVGFDTLPGEFPDGDVEPAEPMPDCATETIAAFPGAWVMDDPLLHVYQDSFPWTMEEDGVDF